MTIRKSTAWLATALLVLLAVAFAATGHWARASAAAAASGVPLILRLHWRKQVGFAVAAVLLSTAITIAFVLGFDLYLHHRYAQSGGYNIWGYRGDTVGRKQPGERRIAFLGGSVAFGYGVGAGETIPAYLEDALNRDWKEANGRVRVVNLGWNSEGAHSFSYTLKDYQYLESDVAIFYSGYNDVGFNNQVFRHQSAVFRLTGYLPILPIIPLRDWLRIRDLSDASSGKVVFKPGIADRYASEAADTALRISRALERQLGKLTPGQEASQSPHEESAKEWERYIGDVRDAVHVALGQQQDVFVIAEPYISDSHFEQQSALAQAIKVEFAGHPRVHYLSAGWTVDLKDRTMCYDGMHLTAAGNREVAAWLATEIAEELEPLSR